jgi:hypothetical protein
MDMRTAEYVLYGITAIGAIVWLFGLEYLIATIRRDRRTDFQEYGLLPPDEMRTPGHLIVGAAEVEGQAADLSARAASVLANLGMSGLLKILERTDDRIVFEGTDRGAAGAAAYNSPSAAMLSSRFHRGQIVLKPVRANRTRIEYAVETPGGLGLVWGAIAFQAAGLVALIVGAWALMNFVISNPNPIVRFQVFQMFQAGHFLWPSFLFCALHRQRGRALRAGLDALVHNLPYTAVQPIGMPGAPPVAG